MSRGLRQGDPLSPLLFIIIGQMVHLLLVRASDVGLIEGISMGNGPKLTHLQFADDTLIILRNTEESCKGIKVVLTLFEIMSGLKINFSKSKLFVNKSDTSVADGWAKHIGCEIGTWPLSYLGVPIGDSHKKK